MQTMDSLNEIQALRAQRELMRMEMKQITSSIDDMLGRFCNDEGETLITAASMMMCNVGEMNQVNDKVRFIRQESEQDILHFITYVDAGGSFGVQDHDVVEICRVVKGHLIESMRDDVEIKMGESIQYEAFEKHKPRADLDSVYDVTFKLNINRDIHITSAQT